MLRRYGLHLLTYYLNLLVALGLSLTFYLILYNKRIIQTDQEYFMFAILTISTISFFALFNLVLVQIRFRWLRFSANLFVLIVLTILLCYQLVRGAPLDFALIYTNMRELFSADGLSQVWEVGGPLKMTAIFIGLASVIFLEWHYKSFSRFHRPQKLWPIWVLSFFGLNLLLFILVPKNPNQLYAFTRSTFQYFQNPDESLLPYMDSPVRYPLLKDFRSSKVFKNPPKHIFIVLIESFSAEYIGKKTDDGREITPYFNVLKEKGLYFENFYANSMQTERGHTGTICSVIPSYRQKIMKTYIDNNFRCLPSILDDNGFITTFIQAQPSLKFDNTGNFMSKIGFQNVLSMDSTFVSPEEKPFVWGWGLQDDLFYKKTFEYLDKVLASKKDARLFTVMATISNHQGFDDMPSDQKYLFATPETVQEAFMNSIFLADHYLKTFIEELEKRKELENSLVFILGDHGFPSGIRQNVSNEMTYYNELFRVPLLAYWPGHIKPQHISDTAFSQMDIAPTIVDWAGINTQSHFAGQPLPLTPAEAVQRADVVPIIQPYDGIYLGSVFHPWKYVRSLSSAEEFLFNLDNDPMETKNLIDDPKMKERLAQLKKGIRRIFLNQRLLREDRLFPPPQLSTENKFHEN